MEHSGRQSTAEGSSLTRHMASSQSESGVLAVLAAGANDHYAVPDTYRDLDEAAAWGELGLNKRSAEYHLGQYCKYFEHSQDEFHGRAVLEHSQAVLTQHDDRLARHEGSRISKATWRLKVEHDKAMRDLLALERILDKLKASPGDADGGFTRFLKMLMWSTVLSSAYFVEKAHFNYILDSAALVVTLCAGYGMTASVYRMGCAYLRALSINRCRNNVRSVKHDVWAGTVDQNGRESLRGYWFNILDWFRVENGSGSRGNASECQSPSHAAPSYVEERSFLLPRGHIISEED